MKYEKRFGHPWRIAWVFNDSAVEKLFEVFVEEQKQ
jgi:hypothetical protein